MLLEGSSFINDEDFVFENTPVKIVASRACPEIELVGFKVGPFEEGKEYEVRFWIAREMEKAGVAVRLEDCDDSTVPPFLCCLKGRPDFRRVVGVVFYDQDAVHSFFQLESAADTCVIFQSLQDRGYGDS